MYKKNFGHIRLDKQEVENLKLKVIRLKERELESKVNNFIRKSITDILNKYKIIPHDFSGNIEDCMFYTLTNDDLGYDLTIFNKSKWTSNGTIRTAQSNQYGVYFAHHHESFKEFLMNLENLCKEIRK